MDGDRNENYSNEDLAVGLCIGVAATVAAPFVIGGGLAMYGFGAGGVVAGTKAAVAHAAIGNVAAGSQGRWEEPQSWLNLVTLQSHYELMALQYTF